MWGRLSIALAVLASSAASCSLVLDTSGVTGGGARDAAPPVDSAVDPADGSSLGDSAGPLDSSPLSDAHAFSDSATDGSTGDSGGHPSDAAASDAPATLTYRATILADKPLAYWRFGEASGTVAADATGHGHGAVLGTGVTWGASGALLNDTNTAIHLDGTQGLVAGAGFDFPGNEPYSLEAWVQADMPLDAQYRHLFTKDYSLPTGREEYGVYLHTGDGLVFERYVTGTATRAVAGAPQLYKWTYVVATYDGTQLSLYVDGTVVTHSQDMRAQASKNSSEFLGCRSFSDVSVQGYLDEFAIYGAALSDAQVAAHWHASGR